MTPRALIAGILLSAVVGAGVFFEIYVQGSNAGGVFFTSPLAVFVFVLLVGLVNHFLRAIHRPLAFTPGELIAIFAMMTVANAAHNPVHYWLGVVTGPFYYANSENNWANLLLPYIPDWVAPRNMSQISAFYEGLEGHATGIAWEMWLAPILSWLPLVVAYQVAFLCLLVVLRRQWADQERLIYPIVQMPIALAEAPAGNAIIGPFFRNWVMWVGFAVPVVIGGFRGLHSYFPFVPDVGLTHSFSLGYETLQIPWRTSFATLGFFFFIKREISFGLWAFYLLNLLQHGLYLLFGIGLEREPAISVFSYNAHTLVHQSMGGLIVLVLGGLYVGRGHLANVFRKAFRGAPEVDDGDEVISYRGAIFGLLASMLVLVVWLHQSGIHLLAVLVFLFFAFVIFISLTRLVAEGGVAVIYTPLVSSDAVISGFGSSFFGPSGMMGLMFTRVWAGDHLNFAMPHFANGLKLGERLEGRRGLFFWGLILASMAGIAGALWMVLTLAYTFGGINLRQWNYVWMPNYFSDYTVTRIGEWTGPHWWGWVHTSFGALVMGLLMLARRLFVWWPLHPLGFPISSTFSWMASNAFLAWLLKGVVLKYGGPSLYRSIRPLFLGMILGQIFIVGLFWIVDAITGKTGNHVFV